MGAVLLITSFAAWIAPAQAAGAQYVYDPAGRLVQVIAPDGTSAKYNYDPAGNITGITRYAASTLTTTGFSNVSGAVGSTITIYGSGFSTILANNTVTINGIAATVIAATANSLTIIIPAGATTGKITVIDSNGTVTSANNLVVSSAFLAPTITSFSPQIGVAGAAVTISGSGFQTTASNNKAYFKNVLGAVSAATATSLSATVPTGAFSGKVSVSTPNGTAISTQDFFITPAGHVAADMGATGRISIDGAPLTLSMSTANKIGLVVFEGIANQIVNLQISGVTFPSNCSNGNLLVLSPVGASVTSSSFCPAAQKITLPATGTYTIQITPYSSDTGNITLKLTSIHNVIAPITIDGAAVGVTTTLAFQQAQLIFTSTTANQVISLQVSGSTYPSGCYSVSVALTGPSLGSANGCATATNIMLGAVGTYTLTITPYQMDTGSITVKLANAPTMTGTAAIGGAAVTTTTTVAAQKAQLTFTSTTANQVISLQVSGSTHPSGCNSVSIVLTGPSPSTAYVGSTNGCTTATNITLGAVGTYTLTITPYQMDTGGVTVKLVNAPTVTATTTIGGAAVTTTTTVAAQKAQLTFTSTTANQVISLQVSGSTHPSGCNSVSIVLTGPSPSTAYVGSTNGCTTATNITLPTVGTYTLTITSDYMDTGSVTLMLVNAPTVTASVAIGGAPVTATTTVAAQLAKLTFTSTTANQVVSLQVSGATYPTGCTTVQVVLTGPSPSTVYVGSTNGCSGATNITLPTVGTYALTITPYRMDTGSVTVTLVNAPTVTSSITIGGASVAMTTTVAAQLSKLTFTSTTANQLVHLQVSGSTYPAGCTFVQIAVRGPLPSTTGIAYPNGCSATTNLTLPTVGTYTLTVTPYRMDIGSITFVLSP